MDLGNCNPFLRKNTKSGISKTLSCETSHNEIRRVKTMVGDENTEKEERRSMYVRGKRDVFSLFPKRKPENDLTPYRSVAIIKARRFRKSRRKRLCLPGAASNTERRVCSGGMDMNYLRITNENIDREHICCAMSNKQSVVKKQWLKQRFAEGLVFYRSEERGKCFIEYIPGENIIIRGCSRGKGSYSSEGSGTA